jgi:integrase
LITFLGKLVSLVLAHLPTADAWSRANAVLKDSGAPYRLRATVKTPFIYVRHLAGKGQAPLAQFSLKPLRADSREDISEALQRCLDAHRLGHWPSGSPVGVAAPGITFAQLAERTLELVNRRLKASSSAHTRGHLRQLATLEGYVTIERLKSWAQEVPAEKLSAYVKRLETLSSIDQVIRADACLAQVLDIRALLTELRDLKPKGGELKRIKDSRRKPKAIPTDQELQDWLDTIADPLIQWAFALIATYGLRPSEAWHVLPIDEHGWITVPGDQLTKTATHVAPALPMAWVERYRLRAQFEQRQQELRQRWRIQWTDLGGRQVPNNNTALSNYLYKQFQLRGQAKLWAKAWEADGQDWCRPYDLRHAYAVRCWSHEESRQVPMAEHAEWMGHGLALHRSTYLKWMTPEARAAAARARAKVGQQGERPEPATARTALPQGITPELLALARQLQALKG